PANHRTWRPLRRFLITPAPAATRSFLRELKNDRGMTARQARQALQAYDLRCWELAGGLEPPTCCLQDSCAAGCATPAGGARVRDQGGGGEWRRRRTSNR